MNVLALVAGGMAVLATVQSSPMPEPPQLPDFPRVLVSLTVERFPVEARNFEYASRAAREDGPVNTEAETQYGFRYYYGPEETEEGCSVAFFEISVVLTMTYPEWTNYGDAASSSRRHWDEMIARLVEHENNHALIAVYSADRIRREVEAAPAVDDCDMLQDTTAAAMAAGAERFRSWQNDYDAATHNGDQQAGFELDAFLAARD